MRTIRLYPLPITLVRISPPALVTSFPTRCFHCHPLIFSLSLTLLSFSSSPIRSFWQHTLASDQVLAFLTNIHRAGITILHGYDFRTNGQRQRESTSPVCREVVLPASTRVALHKIKIPLDRGGLYGEELLCSLDTRQSNSEGAICGGIETQARGRSSKYSRRIGTGKRRGVRTRGRQLLPRSSKLAVTNNTRSFR